MFTVGRVATPVETEALLFAVLLSTAPPVMVAVLFSVPAAGAVTTIVIVADAPEASVPRLHVTVPADWVQAPWLAIAETKVTPAGSGSVTVTKLAVSGPALLTPME